VVDDELLLVAEESFERQRLAVRAVEEVLLVDLDHGQLAELGGGSVLGARDLLFLLQQRLAGGEPLLFGNNLYRLLGLASQINMMFAETVCHTLVAMLEICVASRIGQLIFSWCPEEPGIWKVQWAELWL
jgi:hypothetical protein